MQKTVSIYTLSDPTTHSVRYVGQSQDPVKRFSSHIHNAVHSKKSRHDYDWMAALAVKGIKPEMTVVEEVSINDAGESEAWWISYLRGLGCNLTNLFNGGKVSRGHKTGPATAERRRKISAANRGRVLSPESRKKISDANKGKKASPETVKKISAAHTGIKDTVRVRRNKSLARSRYWDSEEAKARMSIAMKKAWAKRKGQQT